MSISKRPMVRAQKQIYTTLSMLMLSIAFGENFSYNERFN